MSPIPIADKTNRTVRTKAMTIATIKENTKTVSPKTMKRNNGKPDKAVLVSRNALRKVSKGSSGS